ncbi:MAG: flagellar motor switch protein FliN [Pantoea sp.]|uniref:Flagellar motor switch protein FliN n=1 Tax=Pantoea septica TaxID=472695 RepID=A0ABX3UWI2_9GAMM|nr:MULTISPECIES: flagellar motor switch protein FliN [Pantoea]MDU5781173.1 flagellar motor switch protein FliN [Pantoea sp.]MDU5839118.1 flagellar motor switch protein FliN [Pantoea sp.]MDU6443037.1 flagellar motor switch protein FliN [Pantoea sp.]ORN02606.1 flagellar motor switch protein FliN [Pantoea septica]HAT25088.1 flagellar motor switch protein FliN [Pantoea septica]
MSDTKSSSGADGAASDELWGEALNEQFTASASGNQHNFAEDLNLILDIPVKITVELGRTKMTIKELLALSQGSVVALDGLAGEPLDILVNDFLIAQGEVVVISDKFGIRITDIITPSERMQRLSR